MANEVAEEKESDFVKGIQSLSGWGRTLHSFAEWCSPQPGWHILDAGCGPGLLPSIFSNMGYWAAGVDFDLEMFRPSAMTSKVAIADIFRLPFSAHSFDMITASNVIFLLDRPIEALSELKRVLRLGGELAMLNPSENLNERAVRDYVSERRLDDATRNSLLIWAARAVEHHQWNENETIDLYRQAGLRFVRADVKVGPGFGRFSMGEL